MERRGQSDEGEKNVIDGRLFSVLIVKISRSTAESSTLKFEPPKSGKQTLTIPGIHPSHHR